MSNYVFQVSLDQNGLLNAVEFKKSTSAVGQQVAATSGAITAQALNAQNAQLVASQTAVDTARNAVDSAKANRDAAQQKFNLLNASTSPASASDKLNAQIELQQAEAKLADAEQVLERAKNTSRAVQITASAGTPITTSSLTPSTTGFGLPKWTPLPAYNISGNRGAVLFAVNDYMEQKGQDFENKVKLTAAKIDQEAQHIFRTVNIAAGPPTLGPQGLTFVTEGNAVFFFSRDVEEITTAQSLVILTKKPPEEVKNAPKAKLKEGDRRTVVMALGGLGKGSYELTLEYKYDGGRDGFRRVTFTIN
jgi:multidrug efflux pump subunit AcrA (membrane-fusion protein)